MKEKTIKQIEAELGDRSNRFTIWHDGGEWIVSLEGKPENSKTLAELVGDAANAKNEFKKPNKTPDWWPNWWNDLHKEAYSNCYSDADNGL